MNSMSTTMASTYLKFISSSSMAAASRPLSSRFNQNRSHTRRTNGPTGLFLSPRQSRCSTSTTSLGPHASRTFLPLPRAFPDTVVGANEMFRDAGAAALVLSGGYAVVKVFDNLARNGVIPQNLSRKLVHILSGLLFMASWPLFSKSPEARYFASIVPLTNSLRLLIHGLSLVNNEGLIKAVTREGKPEELLRGPLYYVLILALCAVVFWRESPVGVISLSMMCGGDGIADIMGRKFGNVKIPYNQHKSWAGSISMFVFGFLISIGMMYYFSALGYFELDLVLAVKRVALVSFLTTLVESLPITKLVDDNISVPAAAMVVAYICFCM